MRAATALTLALLPALAAAQLAPAPVGPIEPALLLRDGPHRFRVARDASDPSRVVATRDDGAVLEARVDAHALVRLEPGTDLSAHEVEVVRAVAPSIGVYRVRDRRGGDGLDLALRLAGVPGVIDAIPDWRVPHVRRDVAIPPDDPRYPGQWYLERIDIEEAWAISDGDPSVTIVIVDSGCDLAHPDLAAVMDPGLDVVDGDGDPSPGPARGDEHGTACAGLAAAIGDNGEGIAGTCPECRLRCVRLLDGAAAETPISADIEAFQFALDTGAAVVSNSWGFALPVPVPDMLRAIIEAVVDDGREGRGAVVLFAAGNDDREIFDYEIQAVRGVLTVGATNNFDEAAQFSNRGAAVDLVAPTGTLTTDIAGPAGADPGDYTATFGGTSSSCPIAAGVAGLMIAAAPEASGEAVAAALIDTAIQSPYATPDDRGHDLLYGYGRIAPAAALRSLLGLSDPDADAGAPIDGGAGEGAASGCGCRAAPRTEPAALAVLLSWVAVLRPRRRRR
ncbi:MAG TPA: S8 family serine peptidase [Sandaracinaceae bacterium]